MQMRLPNGARTENRVAFVTDIHGEIDSFRNAVRQIQDAKSTKLIIGGDLIDRGASSVECLRFAQDVEDSGVFKEVVLLPGNHEEMFFCGYSASKFETPGRPGISMFDAEAYIGSWIRNGGYVTLQEANNDVDVIWNAMPKQMKDRLSGELPLYERDGDLFFVHAGVEPGHPAEDWCERPHPAGEGPLWIREEFLFSDAPIMSRDGRRVTICHGHTRLSRGTVNGSVEAVVAAAETYGRIGIDTTASGHILRLIAEGDVAHIHGYTPDSVVMPSLLSLD